MTCKGTEGSISTGISGHDGIEGNEHPDEEARKVARNRYSPVKELPDALHTASLHLVAASR